MAYQILALNIEKAYNLREKAIEVVRMYRELARLDGGEEKSYELEFEEPALVTLGFAYEKSRGSRAALTSRCCARWTAGKKALCAAARRARAARGLGARLRRRGGRSGREAEGERVQEPLPAHVRGRARQPAALHEGGHAAVWTSCSPTMTKRARGMNVDKISQEDVARTGGAPEPEE